MHWNDCLASSSHACDSSWSRVEPRVARDHEGGGFHNLYIWHKYLYKMPIQIHVLTKIQILIQIQKYMCCSKYKYKCTNTSVGQDHEGGFHNRSIKFVVEGWGLKFKVEFPRKIWICYQIKLFLSLKFKIEVCGWGLGLERLTKCGSQLKVWG